MKRKQHMNHRVRDSTIAIPNFPEVRVSLRSYSINSWTDEKSA